jgi:hypothetical protein
MVVTAAVVAAVLVFVVGGGPEITPATSVGPPATAGTLIRSAEELLTLASARLDNCRTDPDAAFGASFFVTCPNPSPDLKNANFFAFSDQATLGAVMNRAMQSQLPVGPQEEWGCTAGKAFTGMWKQADTGGTLVCSMVEGSPQLTWSEDSHLIGVAINAKSSNDDSVSAAFDWWETNATLDWT